MSVRNLDASADRSVVTRSFKTSSSLDCASVMMAPESTRPSVDFEALRQPFCEVTLKDTSVKNKKKRKKTISKKYPPRPFCDAVLKTIFVFVFFDSD